MNNIKVAKEIALTYQYPDDANTFAEKIVLPILDRYYSPTSTCLWVLDSIDASYQTECGDWFVINNSESLNANHFRFCFFCGKRIKEHIGA